MKKSTLGFSTRAIRVGQEPDPETRSIIPPLVATSTFAKKSVDEEIPFVYARGNSPTRERWERCVASLEGGEYGIAFSSGMAAIAAVFGLLEKGNRIIATQNLYGGTYRFIETILKKQGVRIDYIPTWDLQAIKSSLDKTVRMIYIESPSNPLMRVSDIAAIGEFAHAGNIPVVVDNTFLSPYFQRPLELGADISLHSATKYLGGHSDLISGCVITNDKTTAERLRLIQNAAGAIPSSFDCWLLLRSVKTLSLRMEKHNSTAAKIAEILSSSEKVVSVRYPGLKSHPDYHVVVKQQKTEKGKIGFGGMITVEFEDSGTARVFIESLRYFTIAESLGGVESLAGYPFTMSHSGVPARDKIKMGISETMVRMSVGIEDQEDLIADVRNALKEL